VKRRNLLAAVAAATLAGAPVGAMAQANYPTKPITVIVPFAAGGPTDALARVLTARMGEALGQTMIVENVGGAGGTIGVSKAARATPDGYTILFAHMGTLAVNIALYKTLPYDSQKDFEPIGLGGTNPMVLVAKKDLPAKDFKEFETYVKANQKKAQYGMAGIGAASHLGGLMLNSMMKVDVLEIPYKGTGPAMTDVLGGQVDLMCDQTTNTTSHIQGGKVKAYGVTTKTRVKNLPNLPTLDEAGLKGFDLAVWHGIYAPKGTPKDVVAKLTAALQTALKDPKVIERFAALGTEPVSQSDATPAAHTAKLKSEIDKWRPLIQKAGVFAD